MLTDQHHTTFRGHGPLGPYTIRVQLPKRLSEPKRLTWKRLLAYLRLIWAPTLQSPYNKGLFSVKSSNFLHALLILLYIPMGIILYLLVIFRSMLYYILSRQLSCASLPQPRAGADVVFPAFRLSVPHNHAYRPSAQAEGWQGEELYAIYLYILIYCIY